MLRSLALVLAVALTACSTINPAYKAKTDALVTRTGQHQEAAPSSYQPKRWKAGSWIAFKTVSDGRPSYTKMSVLSHGPEGYWVETESWSYETRNLSKALYRDMPMTKDEATQNLVRVMIKTNEEPVQTFEMNGSDPIANMYRTMMGSVSVTAPRDVSDAPKEAATVAAGSFEGTARINGTWSFGPVSQTVVTWWHPNVPLNGGVKGVSTDGRFTLELLDYGWSGATSAFEP
jgi:hypothetical protein